MAARKLDPTGYMTMPQCQELWRIWQDKEITVVYKMAEDDLDNELNKLRSIAIWEAQEWTERGVS
jgi:hypothetical protein